MKARDLVHEIHKRMRLADIGSTVELRHGRELIVFDAAGAQMGEPIVLEGPAAWCEWTKGAPEGCSCTLATGCTYYGDTA